MTDVRLCAGVDPVGADASWQSFTESLTLHSQALDQSPHSPGILKPNLAFFLAHGSKGLLALEEFVAHHRQAGREIILDCKCNEIANSLEAWLRFAFVSLGATGVTVNPFLGERTLNLAFETAARHAGDKARVYVLCATSEFGSGPLGFLQSHPERIVEACVEAREQHGGGRFPRLAGVVVGANREDVLFSPWLAQSGLSVLAPGLGAQGAAWSVVERCRGRGNEVTFPVSRGLFGGGKQSLDQTLTTFADVAQHFDANESH